MYEFYNDSNNRQLSMDIQGSHRDWKIWKMKVVME